MTMGLKCSTALIGGIEQKKTPKPNKQKVHEPQQVSL